MSQPRAAAPVAAGAPGAPGARPAAAQQDNKWLGIVKSVGMMLAIQVFMQHGLKYLGIGQGTPSAPAPVPVPASAPGEASAASATPAVSGPRLMDPAWPLGTTLSMILFTSTSPFASIDQATQIVRWDEMKYGDWNDARAEDLFVDVPQSVRSGNSSWWMDIVLVKDGGELRSKGPDEVAVYRKQLTRFLPKRRIRKEKKLIGGDEDESSAVDEDASQPKEIVAHWSRNLTLTIVSNGGRLDYNQIQPPLRPAYQITPAKEGVAQAYYPPVFANDFWLLRENMYPINATDTQLPLRVMYHALGNMKFQIFASLGQGFEAAAHSQGGSASAELDEVKRMLTETSPWLLITTAVVTVLHMVFEMLAFSSDVSHWRKKDKDLVGVSLNTILTNCFVQLVILLYLQDSSEETSMMILFTQGIGLVIEAWKITKVVDVRVRPAPNSIIPYRVTFEDKKELSEDEKKTQEYDKLAFRLVSYFAGPLLLGYAGYSLMYETHRSWYSFVVSTLAQAIYMFGFVQLIPQLIINYKLKSVAHMPMKAMMYKTLSTVVDDFFAFCIRMPWLHRLACFRDDVVFVILLYQRYIYRVDYSRVNEFGQVAEGKAEPVGDKAKAEALKGEVKETKKNK